MKLRYLFFYLISTCAFAQDYSVVSISGFLEWKSHDDPANHLYSAIHHEYNENLNSLVKSRHKFNHGVSKKKLRKAIEEIGCQNKTETKLIIVTNSWGSRKAHILSNLYFDICGEETELFIQIDGVAKPIGPQKRIPKAKNCINYHQSQTPILRGTKVDGCDNRSFSHRCTKQNKKIFENCHMYTARKAAEHAQNDIYNYIKLGNTDWYEQEFAWEEEPCR